MTTTELLKSVTALQAQLTDEAAINAKVRSDIAEAFDTIMGVMARSHANTAATMASMKAGILDHFDARAKALAAMEAEEPREVFRPSPKPMPGAVVYLGAEDDDDAATQAMEARRVPPQMREAIDDGE
jgi:hypothetical protein